MNYDEIKQCIEENRKEIIDSGDWFYAFDTCEINVTDYCNAGEFIVTFAPRNGCVTDWDDMMYLPSLNFNVEDV